MLWCWWQQLLGCSIHNQQISVILKYYVVLYVHQQKFYSFAWRSIIHQKDNFTSQHQSIITMIVIIILFLTVLMRRSKQLLMRRIWLTGLEVPLICLFPVTRIEVQFSSLKTNLEATLIKSYRPWFWGVTRPAAILNSR